MRLSDERIKSLQVLAKELWGLELTDEQAQEVGMAIMRFVIAKAQRETQLNVSKEKKDERRYAKTA